MSALVAKKAANLLLNNHNEVDEFPLNSSKVTYRLENEEHFE